MFKAGEIVRLKSGGFPMVVELEYQDNWKPSSWVYNPPAIWQHGVVCVWHGNDGALNREPIKPHLLEIVNSPKD